MKKKKKMEKMAFFFFFFFFFNGLNCMTVLSVLHATGKCEVGCQGRR